MKIKKIMLVTLLLLAILTVGAVSASEDIASDDNLAASDDVDIIADEDEGGEEGFEEESESPINIYEEAYVGENIIDVMLESESEGNISISYDGTEYFNQELSDDWDSEPDDEDDNYVHYYINSNMLDPELTAGEYELTVNYLDETGELILNNTNTVKLFERNTYENETYDITINIEVLKIDIDDDNAIISIKANTDASNLINVTLTNDDESYEFVKELNEISDYEVDEDDDTYNWYFIKASNFEDIKAGDYQLTLIYYADEDTTIQRDANIRLVQDEEDGEEEDEEFDFDVEFKHVSHVEFDWWMDVLSINNPGEGNFTITISNNGTTNTIIKELNNKSESYGWKLTDLNITKMGIYEISVAYILEDETDVFNGTLMVSEAIVPNEFDITDENAVLVSVYCPENATGIIVVRAIRDDDDWEIFKELNYTISNSDYNTYLNWTLSDFEITEGENFIFQVYVLENDEESIDGEDGLNMLLGAASHAFNPTQFRTHVPREINVISDSPIASIFCPDGSTGNVTVIIIKYDEDENPHNFTSSVKNIADKDENNWIHWNLSELGIDEGDYKVKIIVNDDEENAFTDNCEVYSPIWISETSYIETDDEDRIEFVNVEISSNITEASIIIKINGSEEFNKNLSDFTYRDERDGEWDVNGLYWHHPRMYGETRKDLKSFDINTKNIGYEFSQGIYNVEVILNIVNNTSITQQANVTIAKINSASKDGFTIEIFDAGEYYINDDELSLIHITTPEDIDGGYVRITIKDNDDWYRSWDLSDFEDDINIYPSDFGLDAGTYNMIVTIYNKNDEEILNNTASITLNYGEDGIMSSELSENMEYTAKWAIRIDFAIDDISGNLTIKFDGVEYYNGHITITSDDYEDEDEDNPAFSFSPWMLGVGIGHYDTVEIIYNGDNGVNDVDTWKNINVIADEPEIYTRFSDYESRLSQYGIKDNNFIGVHVNGDNISSVRIVVKCGDETYLDAMLKDLNLTPIYDSNSFVYGYYDIGLIHFNKTFNIGEHYENVVAYYYSDNYSLNTTKDRDSPKFFDVIGIMDEIDVNDVSDVVYVIADESRENIILRIWNHDGWEELEPIEYNIQEGDNNSFIKWKISDLGLEEGFYHIEVKYSDDSWIFDDDFSVVNKSKFYVKMDCEWFYTTDAVVSIWCPEDASGTIYIIDRDDNNINNITHPITEEDKGNYIRFTLKDLNITSPNWYGITVKVDEEVITDNDGLNVPNPIEFPDFNTYLPENGYSIDDSLEIVRIALPSDASGNITIAIDDVEYFNKNINEINYTVDGFKYIYKIYTSDLNSLKTGTQGVTVTFNDIKSDKVLNFRERNIKSEDDITIVILNGDVCIYWGGLIAEIIAPWDANGNVEVYLNDDLVANWDELGWIDTNKYNNTHLIYYIYMYDLDVEDVGEYNIEVVYNDSISNSANILLIGDKANNVGLWDYYEDIGIYDNWFHINNDGEYSGRIVLTVNGEIKLNKTLTELDVAEWGEYVFTPANASVGIGYYKDVIIGFYSDEDYSYQLYRIPDGEKIFWGKIDINLINEDVNIWESISNIHAPKEANGTIIFKIGDKEYFTCTLKDLNGNVITEDPNFMIYSLIIPEFTNNITAGHYDNVMIYYYGEDDYNTTNLNSWDPASNITVWDNSSVEMKDISFEFGTQGNISVSVVGGTIASENITIDPSGAQINYENNMITISNIGYGTYTLRVVTTPNEYYYSVDKTVTVKVVKTFSEINFTNNITFDYGGSGSTTVNLTGATITRDNITVIDHDEAVIDLTGNVITVSGLDSGSYTLKVTTTPDDDHSSVDGFVDIIVGKVNASITFNNTIVFDYGGSGSTNFTVIGGTLARENITFVGLSTCNIDLTGDIITVSNVSAGSYYLEVTVTPDANHNAVNSTIAITVNKVNATITFDDNITYDYGSIGNVTFTVIGGDLREFNVNVEDSNGNGMMYRNITIVDNVLYVSNLDAGNYTLTATVTADNDHNEVVGKINVTVRKVASNVTFSNIAFDYGASGNTTVVVDGAVINYDNITIENHPEAIISYENDLLTVSNLSAGTYTLKVTTTPDKNHYSVDDSITITVNKIDSSVNFDHGITFITGSSGSTTVTVVGELAYENITVEGHPEANITYEGNVITVSNLTNGTYTLNVTTSDTVNFNSVKASINITVSDEKIYPTFDLIIEATRADSPVVINVTAVSSFSGDVVVKIGETNVTVAIRDGFGSNSTNLEANTYNAVLNFTGNDFFTEQYTNKTFKVKVIPVDPNLNISASDVEIGNPVVIFVTTNTTFTGDVSVKIGEREEIAHVVGGIGNVTFNDLSADTYTATAIFSETEYFTSSEKNTTFTVKKINPALTVSIEPVYYGSDIVVAISTDKTFNGNVSVKTQKENLSASIVNGSGSVALKDYEIGNHNVNVVFDETEKFTAGEANATAVVKKLPVDPALTISVASITQGANAVVKITTNNTFTGTVTVKIANKNYNVAVKNGAGSTSISGLAVGTYNAVATFAATSDFTSSVKTATFKVNKKADVISLTLKTVKVKKSAKKLTLQATLKVNGKVVKGKQIVFKFNGKTLKAKTTAKGIAKVTVKKAVLKKLKVGKKITYQATYLKTTVKKTAKVKK